MFGSTPQKKVEKLEAQKVKLQAKITTIDGEILKLKATIAATPAPVAPAPVAPVTPVAPVAPAPAAPLLPPPQYPYYPPK